MSPAPICTDWPRRKTAGPVVASQRKAAYVSPLPIAIGPAVPAREYAVAHMGHFWDVSVVCPIPECGTTRMKRSRERRRDAGIMVFWDCAERSERVRARNALSDRQTRQDCPETNYVRSFIMVGPICRKCLLRPTTIQHNGPQNRRRITMPAWSRSGETRGSIRTRWVLSPFW